jgi:hypothetical protein
MRRRPQTSETPWWLRRPNPNASSAPPLPPEAVRYLQEEDKRRWAKMASYAQKPPADSPNELDPPPPEAAAPSAPVAAPVVENVAANEAPAVSPDPGPPMPEPLSSAPESIDQTFDAIAKFIRKHLVCSDHQLTVLTLWVVHTYCFDLFAATPYLNIVSPENQSGKTICLQLLSLLSCKPWMPSGIPKSRIMSHIAKSQPTLLLDDWDTLFRPSGAQPIVGFLNAGSTGSHRKPDDPEHDDSPLNFCPKAFAGLGCLPASLADRCLPITLQRKKPKESVHPFWLELYRPKATGLVEPLPAWVEKNGQELMFAAGDFLYEPLPAGFTMRQRDFIVPLLAIAKIAGGPWLRKARMALRRILNTAPIDPPSDALQLLSDIRDVFAEKNDPPNILTVELLKCLNRLEDRPWKKQNPLTPMRLRILLRNFPIPRSGSQRIGKSKETFKGFTRRHFAESWQRYLPELAASRLTQVDTNKPHPCQEADATDDSQASTDDHQAGTDDAQQVSTEDHHASSDDPQQVGTGEIQPGTSNLQVGTDGLQVGTKPAQVGTNTLQVGTNSEPGIAIPNVVNIHRALRPTSKLFKPKQIPRMDQPATEHPSIPDP